METELSSGIVESTAITWWFLPLWAQECNDCLPDAWLWFCQYRALTCQQLRKYLINSFLSVLLSIFEFLCSPVKPNSRRAPHYFIHCLVTKPCRSPNEWLSGTGGPVDPAQPLVTAKHSTLGLPLCNSVLVAVGAQQFITTLCKVTTEEANGSGVQELLCNFILIRNEGCSLTSERCAFPKVFRVPFWDPVYFWRSHKLFQGYSMP